MTPEPAPIRLLICEDQRLLRESLRVVLDLEPGLVVIGEAGDGVAATQQAVTLHPDVILMDIKMPLQDGVAATAAIVTRQPDANVIILTTFDAEHYVFDAIAAGARGYLLKDVPTAELVATIRRVHAGDAFIQPGVATKLLMDYAQRGRLARPTAGAPPPAAPADDLSDRELAVLRLLARGESNRDIADHLCLAEGTIKNYVSAIISKLYAANRTHAATLARERGLL